MSLFCSWHGVSSGFLRDGVKGLYWCGGDYKAWRIPLKVRAKVYVEGTWKGANLRVRMAHTTNLQDWFSIDGGEFPSISANGEHTIEYIQPTRFERIEYWLENPDKFTLIRFYVEIDPQENPIGEYEGRTDILDDQKSIVELFAFGEGIQVNDIDPDEWKEHPLHS